MKGRKRVGEDRAHPIQHTAANAAEYTRQSKYAYLALCQEQSHYPKRKEKHRCHEKLPGVRVKIDGLFNKL